MVDAPEVGKELIIRYGESEFKAVRVKKSRGSGKRIDNGDVVNSMLS